MVDHKVVINGLVNFWHNLIAFKWVMCACTFAMERETSYLSLLCYKAHWDSQTVNNFGPPGSHFKMSPFYYDMYETSIAKTNDHGLFQHSHRSRNVTYGIRVLLS